MSIKGLLARICYRVWQFKQVLLPHLDYQAWQTAVAEVPLPVRQQLEKLKKSEKAHIIRVYQDISNDKALDSQTRQILLELALLHDIGKSITRPTLLFKVAKVIFSFANNEHCIAGAKFLRRHNRNKALIKRVLRHHDIGAGDDLLLLFQKYDDRN
jgi:putative nucleotidyltransferase with HDIG domain